MSIYSKFLQLGTGKSSQVDLAQNTLAVLAQQLNGSTSGSLTLHANATTTSYNLFFPNAQGGSNTTLINDGSGNLSWGSATISDVLDGTFRIDNTSDPTKKIAFDASGITTGTTRTLKMADANVDLANLTNSNISASAAIVYSKLSLSNSIVNADIASAAAIAYSKLASLGGSTNAVLTQDSGGHVQASSILSTNLFLADGSVNATGAFNLNSHKINNLTDPTSPQDGATKFYVDNLVAGLSWKTYARAGSTANVSVASAPSTIDGVTLVSGDRVLLKNQTAGAENGIYVFTAAASPLTRATDMNTWNEVVGSVLLVTEGTTNVGSKWVNTNVSGGTLGTTAITFTAFSVAGTVNGTGTSGYVAYWNGTSSLTAEQYLAAVRGGLGVDASGFTGILHFASGVATASLIVNADVSASAGIVYSKLSLSNSIVNADIAAGAAIAYSKLTLTNSIVLGDLTSNSVDENKIVSSAFSASGAITGGSGTKIAWVPDGTSLEISSNAARIKTTAYDQVTITGGSGSAAAVQRAPALVRTLIAGQSFSANTSYAVRWGLTANGETAGRVYAADPTTSSFDLFYVIGMASSTSAVSAGQNITVTSHGSFNLGTADTAFASNTDGAPVFLTASGTFSTTAPTTSGLAVTRVGIVQVRSATANLNVIDVFPVAVGVN